jgi:hypothetical protein
MNNIKYPNFNKSKNFTNITDIETFLRKHYDSDTYEMNYFAMDKSFGWHIVNDKASELAFFSMQTNRGYAYYPKEG